MAQTARTPSLSQQAYTVLRRDLIAGELEPGIKLMIADLQSRYALGAMPLREALNRLSAEGMVDKTDQRGFFVPALNYDDYLDIQNARIAIEAAALRETVTERTAEWEDQMVVCMHRLRRAGPAADAQDMQFIFSDAWGECHRKFHITLISGCSNARLLAFAANLFEQSARYRMRRRKLSFLRAPVRDRLVEEHATILDAALAGDADAAVERLVDHYRYSVEIVLGRPVGLSADKTRFLVTKETDDTSSE